MSKTDWERIAAEADASAERRRCFTSAEENASYTGDERGFPEHSPEWYAVFYRSYIELWESGMYAPEEPTPAPDAGDVGVSVERPTPVGEFPDGLMPDAERARCRHDGRPIARRTHRPGTRWSHVDEEGGIACADRRTHAEPDIITAEALKPEAVTSAKELTRCGICWREMTREELTDHTHEMDGKWDPR